MMTFVLAAAAATAQPAISTDPDARCLAAYLVAAGSGKGEESALKAEQAGNQAIVMYFLGKLDVRRPGADLRTEVMRLVSSPGYGAIIGPDIERCSSEAEGRGKYLQSWDDKTESAAAKP